MGQNSDMGVRVRMTTQTVPDNVQHKPRDQEIEELPTYLDPVVEPVANTAGNTLCLINYGPNEPGVDGRSYPWVKTDAGTGYLLGLFVWNTVTSTWTETAP